MIMRAFGNDDDDDFAHSDHPPGPPGAETPALDRRFTASGPHRRLDQSHAETPGPVDTSRNTNVVRYGEQTGSAPGGA